MVTKRQSNPAAEDAGFDVRKWAFAVKRGHGGAPCSVCSHPATRKAVEEVLRAMRDGADPSIDQIQQMLAANFGFRYTVAAVRNHLVKHTDFRAIRDGA